jgi:hypothetical protein
MSRRIAGSVLAAFGVALATALPHGQTPAALITTNRTLQDRLDRIAAGSPSWRAAVDAVARAGRRALVLTPDQVVVADGADRRMRAFDATVLAEAAPVPREDSRVDTVMVVVNLRLLEDIHDRQGSLPAEFHADLDRILVHEIYGHALPYLIAGNLAGRCPDPAPGERAADACAIRRENAIRAELGLGRRTDYGLQGLWLARRDWR